MPISSCGQARAHYPGACGVSSPGTPGPSIAAIVGSAIWCRLAGESGRALAAALGVSHQAVSDPATRGERTTTRWHGVRQQLQ